MKKILLAAILCAVTVGASGADIQKLVQDTQRLAQEPSKITLVWWIPTEFWDAVLKDNPNVSEEARKKFHDTLSGYLVFAVVAVDVGPMGGMTPRGRAAMESETRLVVNGEAVPFLKNDKINPDAVNFVSMMKPMMSNMLGQFGQGMEFLLYPNPVKDGMAALSATEKGAFTYTAFGHQFEWRLPLGSLLPPKVDPATGETFPGNYRFNPYTGAKLSDK